MTDVPALAGDEQREDSADECIRQRRENDQRFGRRIALAHLAEETGQSQRAEPGLLLERDAPNDRQIRRHTQTSSYPLPRIPTD